MIRHAGGGLIALLLLSVQALADDGEPVHRLVVSIAATGTALASIAMPQGSGWCVIWNHSVKGFEVSDCYENRGGEMVLVRSHLPDFAAGLDHIPGRGVQVSDGMGGYWIENLDEPVAGNAYILRPGSAAVDHRIRTDRAELSLSAMAPRARLRIALVREGNS